MFRSFIKLTSRLSLSFCARSSSSSRVSDLLFPRMLTVGVRLYVPLKKLNPDMINMGTMSMPNFFDNLKLVLFQLFSTAII